MTSETFRDQAARIEAFERFRAALDAAHQAFKQATAEAEKEYEAATAPIDKAWGEAMDAALAERDAARAAAARLPAGSPERLAAEKVARDRFEAARKAADETYRRQLRPIRDAYLKAITPAAKAKRASCKAAEREYERALRAAR